MDQNDPRGQNQISRIGVIVERVLVRQSNIVFD